MCVEHVQDVVVGAMVKLLANRLPPMLVSQVFSVLIVASLQRMILNGPDGCDAWLAIIEMMS